MLWATQKLASIFRGVQAAYKLNNRISLVHNHGFVYMGSVVFDVAI